jgi:hypothetical protein
LFSRPPPEKKLDLYYKSEKIPGLQDLLLWFEADLDFSRPWFSEIKVQIKRLTV